MEPELEIKHNPDIPVFVPTDPTTWPDDDLKFDPVVPETWPPINPPPGKVITPPKEEVIPPNAKPPSVPPKVSPRLVQQVARQLGVPATSQIAIDVTEALYSTMDYFDPFGDPFADTKMRPVSTTNKPDQTKMAQGGYLDTMLAEDMSVDDLLNLLR